MSRQKEETTMTMSIDRFPACEIREGHPLKRMAFFFVYG